MNTGSTTRGGSSTASPQIANFVIARHLDRAPHAVQIQALELLRTRRIFTRTTVQVAPKQFVLVPVLAAASGGRARVTPHLNDFLSIAHWHDPEHGFVNVEEQQQADADDDDAASTGSIVKRVRVDRHPAAPALISKDVRLPVSLWTCLQLNTDAHRRTSSVFVKKAKRCKSTLTSRGTR